MDIFHLVVKTTGNLFAPPSSDDYLVPTELHTYLIKIMKQGVQALFLEFGADSTDKEAQKVSRVGIIQVLLAIFDVMHILCFCKSIVSDPLHHIHMWQLSCSISCHIWIWYSIGKHFFDH